MMNNYYTVGTKEDPVISNSSLSCLNSEEGGSVRKFINFFSEREEEKISLSLTRGKLIHKYIEDSSKFIVDEGEKPTPMMSGFIETLILEADNIKNGINYQDVSIELVSNLKSEKTKQADILQAKADFEKLGNALQISTDDTIRVFRIARGKTNAYKSKGDSVLISDIANNKQERDYIKFLLSARDKIILQADEKEKIVGATTSLFNHPKVSALLGLGNNDFDTIIGETYSEVPIYWQETITEPITGKKVTINCKALLDKVTVNHTAKVLQIKDLKTTRRSIYQYQISFEEYHTYRQMSIYNRALKFWFNALFPDKNFNDYKIETYMIPVETFGLYQTTIYHVSQPWLFKGNVEAKNLLIQYGWHKITGEYRYSPSEVLFDHILHFKNPV